MNADGSHETNVTKDASCPIPDAAAEQHYKWSPVWSPDGRWIAFVSGSCRIGCALCLLDVGDGTITSLTAAAEKATSPSWSPDGKWLAFVSTRDQLRGEIYIMNLETRSVRRLTDNLAVDWSPAWSPAPR